MNKSWIAAGVVVLATVGWFASGSQSESPPPAPPARMAGTAQPFLVEVADSVATPVEQILSVPGVTRPLRAVTVRARITSTVEEILVREGERVAAGDVIVRLDVEDRSAALTRAQAAADQATADYQSAEGLSRRGAVSETDLRGRFTQMQTAKADLETAQLALANVEIKAPFDGIFDRRTVEIGDRVTPDMEGGIGSVIDNSKLIADIEVPQQAIAAVRPGVTAEVVLLDGRQFTGTVTFVASSAEPETRTFRAEVEIDNRDGTLPAGMSAKILLPTATVSAHLVSPAVLILDDQGRLGAMVVEDDKAQFLPVTMVRATGEGIWVAGLPDEARIVTGGQGFVRPGEPVRISTAPAPAPQSAAAPAAEIDG